MQTYPRSDQPRAALCAGLRPVMVPGGRWTPNAWMEGVDAPRVPIAVREISLDAVVFESTIPLTIGAAVYLTAAITNGRVTIECTATSQEFPDETLGDRVYRCEARITEIDPHKVQKFADQY